jgi:HAMP domain-containing protein/putative methionine-R-sulfoxide reductase with GAF domain
LAKAKFNLSGQFAVGSIAMVGIVLSIAVYAFTILDTSSTVSQRITNTIQPSIDALRLMRTQLAKSEALVNAWVNEPSEEKQEELTNMHNVSFQQVTGNADTLVSAWENVAERDSASVVFARYQQALTLQQQLMQNLQTFEDYMENMGAVMPIQEELSALCGEVKLELSAFEALKELEVTTAQNEMIGGFSTLKMLLLILIVTVILVGFVLYALVNRGVAAPIKKLTTLITNLSVGEIPENKQKVRRSDEIGEISNSFNDLVEGIKKVSEFAQAIGEGQLEAEFEPLGDDDLLGKSLVTMRANIKITKAKEQRESWTNEGLAKFGTILRTYSEAADTYYPKLITNIAKYMNCQVGAIYLVSNVQQQLDESEEQSDPYLELAGTYAYIAEENRNVSKGEGILGQTWQDKEILQVTDIPLGYIPISSGLGGSPPSNLICVPLVTNEEVLGVIELASFSPIEAHGISFMEKLAETIAASIMAIHATAQTKTLLKDSRAMIKKTRIHEEELEQNSIILIATQEEMQRNNAVLNHKMRSVEKIVGKIEFNGLGQLSNKEELASRLKNNDAEDSAEN